jgi:hypothetical protein
LRRPAERSVPAEALDLGPLEDGAAASPAARELEAAGGGVAARVGRRDGGAASRSARSLPWVTCPILRFEDSPKIVFDFIQRYDIPAVSTGTVQPNGT